LWSRKKYNTPSNGKKPFKLNKLLKGGLKNGGRKRGIKNQEGGEKEKNAIPTKKRGGGFKGRTYTPEETLGKGSENVKILGTFR